MAKKQVVLALCLFLVSGFAMAAGSEMRKVKKGEIELSPFRINDLQLSGGHFRCGWFSGQTWHLLIERNVGSKRYYKDTATGTGEWLKLTLYIDHLTINHQKQKIGLAEDSRLLIAKGWVDLSNGESFKLSDVDIVVGEQCRRQATYRTDKYKNERKAFLIAVVIIAVIVIMVIKVISESNRKAEIEEKQREQEKAQEQAEAKRKRERLAEIDDYYERIRSRIREVGENQRIRDSEIDALLQKLLKEYREASVKDFRGVRNTDYFWDRGWDLLVDLADRCGIAVCYTCETINPRFCKNHHCQKCNSSENDRGCLLCAKGRGYDVCMSCKTVESERCPSCGVCGCSVNIYGAYCSRCD